jgi:2-polyprenyl-6-hydroxyphenyl methylase / 3-demethylubiquinone-9 3-methyltransferase
MFVSNNDPIEISKFSSMANDWWDPKGPCKPLHEINPVRLTFIKNHAVLQDRKIIDIGCGGGLLTEVLAKNGARVTGIDQSEQLITIAKQHATQQGLTIQYLIDQAEICAITQNETYDIACCLELLEHVPQPSTLIHACSKLVKSNGWVFFSTINRHPYAYLTTIIAAEYVLKLLPKGTHHYEKFIRPSELATVARKAGLILKKLQGIDYNPLMQTVRLTKSVSSNYIMAFQKV